MAALGGGNASNSTRGTADCSAERRPGSTASGSSYRRTGTGTKQTAADKTLCGIVRIGTG